MKIFDWFENNPDYVTLFGFILGAAGAIFYVTLFKGLPQDRLSKTERFVKVSKTLLDADFAKMRSFGLFSQEDLRAMRDICSRTFLRPSELIYILRTNSRLKIDWARVKVQDPKGAEYLKRIYKLQGRVKSIPEDMFNKIKNMDLVPESLKKNESFEKFHKDLEYYQEKRAGYFKDIENSLEPLLFKRRQQQQELKRRLADRMKKQRDKALDARARLEKKMRRPNPRA